MAKVYLVPEEDMKVLRKYLDGNAVVLVTQSAIDGLKVEGRDDIAARALEFCGEDVDYCFTWGEPDISVDIVSDADPYTWLSNLSLRRIQNKVEVQSEN